MTEIARQKIKLREHNIQISRKAMTTALEIDEGLLDAFIGDGSITDVLYVVRSGKEATVYCCRGAAGGKPLVAAKVYRPLNARNFHNDAVYQVGRDAPMSSRDKRALANKSRHGRDLQNGKSLDPRRV